MITDQTLLVSYYYIKQNNYNFISLQAADKRTATLVRPVSAVAASVAAEFRSDALSARPAREVVLVTRDQVAVLLLRVVAAVVVPVADESARDAARRVVRTRHLAGTATVGRRFLTAYQRNHKACKNLRSYGKIRS